MLLPPIIERELRVALRQRKPVKSRLGAAAVGLGISFLLMLPALLGAGRTWGRSLHQFLYLAGLFFAVVRPAQACIGLFSDERRNQTLELLYLTGMNSMELFTGKLLGGFLVASSDLLALTPFLALPFLGGGVSLELFLATIVSLPLLLCFTVAVTVLASVVCKDDGTAFVLALALAGLLSVVTPLPYALGKALTGTAPFPESWLWLSPGYGAVLVGTGFTAGPAVDFWPTATITALWTMLCLALAAAGLARNWREDPDRIRTGWSSRLESFLSGNSDSRAVWRQCLLDRNAFQWLVQRQRRSVLLAWASIGTVCLLWLGGWCAWPHHWASTVNLFITAMLLLVLVDNLQPHAAARRIGEDRRDGTLELLLTTPVHPVEIVTGQLAAVRAQFQPVRRVLFGLCGLMALGGLFTRGWNLTAVVCYLLIWTVLMGWSVRSQSETSLLAMWVALNTGRPTYAVFRSLGVSGGWGWIWILFNAKHAITDWGRSATRFPSGSVLELGIVSLVVLLVLLVTIGKRRDLRQVRNYLIDDMRLLAQEPVPAPHDPRFKQWKDVRLRLPPG